jgi:hypothetical protein
MAATENQDFVLEAATNLLHMHYFGLIKFVVSDKNY